MGNRTSSARTKAQVFEPPSRCETKEEQSTHAVAWRHCNRLNKDGNYTILQSDEQMIFFASAGTITLMDGWTTAHTEKLRAAVKDVVAANPILSGKVVAGEGGKGLAIARTEHKTLDPATLNVVAGPSDFEPPADIVARCSYCQDVLGPLVPNLGNPTRQKSSGGPLFNVSIINLPGHRAAYSISISHILGDGWTRNALHDQLDCLVNERALKPLVWDDPGVSIEMNHWSDRDKFRSSKLPVPAFICRMLYNFFMGGSSSQILGVIGSDKMAELKEASRGSAAFVSTSDVVSAAVHEMFDNKIVIIVTGLRSGNRLPGLPQRIAGNFYRSLLHPREDSAGSPAFIREKLISSPSGFFGRNEVPFWPMFMADIGTISNWTSLTKFIVAPNTTVLCHVPHRSFVETWPLNMAIIFQADPTTIACLHNVKPSKVKARAVSAKLFQKVFKLPAD